MIYHYTTIETLALILESKKMRFNNLTGVDDILEGSLFPQGNLSPHIFVSCWTRDPTENVALWQMYTHGKGVRIGLPDYPWKKQIFDAKDWSSRGFAIMLDDNIEYYSPFTYDDVFGDGHMICAPYFLPYPLNNGFAKDVIYLDDEELIERYQGVYNEQLNQMSGQSELILKTNDFGLYKHKRWEFQKEFRFVLCIFPLAEKPDFARQKVHEVIINTICDYLKHQKESNIKDFYLELPDTSIQEMGIVTGPLSTKADEIIVQSLMDKYDVKTVLKKSNCNIRK